MYHLHSVPCVIKGLSSKEQVFTRIKPIKWTLSQKNYDGVDNIKMSTVTDEINKSSVTAIS